MYYGEGMYIRKACTSLRAVIWVSGTEHFGQLIGGHRPSTLAILLPLVEMEYIPVKQCALLIHPHVPQLVWNTFS